MFGYYYFRWAKKDKLKKATPIRKKTVEGAGMFNLVVKNLAANRLGIAGSGDASDDSIDDDWQ